MSNLSIPPTTVNSNNSQNCQSQQLSLTVPQQNALLSQNGMNVLDHYRLSQLYQYALAAERLRCPTPSSLPSSAPGNSSLQPVSLFRPEFAAAAAASAVPFIYSHPYYRLDPRLALFRPPEEPKPQHSYIGLIAMAILSSPDKKLVLSDIYQYILDNYAYFRTRGHGWRNSIRHNLSLNDCFVKAGRSANGKGHYWAIHPANIDDFQRGDFRRRKAQRKVRRHMGLAVDDEDSPSPPPNSPPLLPLLGPPGVLPWSDQHLSIPHHTLSTSHVFPPLGFASLIPRGTIECSYNSDITCQKNIPTSESNVGNICERLPKPVLLGQKRQFDVASLLAVDKPEMKGTFQQVSPSASSVSRSSDIDDNDQFSSSPSLDKTYPKSSSPHSCADEEENDEDKLADQSKRKRTEESKFNTVISQIDLVSGNREQRIQNQAASLSSFSRKHRIPQRLEPHSFHCSNLKSCSNYSAEMKNLSQTKCVQSPPFLEQTEGRHDQIVTNKNNVVGPSADSSNNHSQNTNQIFLQQNPSLASLMIFSSRYREFSTSMQQQNITSKKS